LKVQHKLMDKGFAGRKALPREVIPASASRPVWRRWMWIGLALLAFLAILLAPLPAVGPQRLSVSPEGRASFAVVILCLILWVSEAIPIAVTSLAIFLLMPALGVASISTTIQSGLGHPLILFFLSLFLISAAFEKAGLGRRVSAFILALSRGNSALLLLWMLAVGALLSMGVNALAATTVLLGTAQQIWKDTHHAARSSNFSRRLFLAVSWGPLIGSVGTPLGTGSNILTMAYLETLAARKMSFLEWMGLGIPLALILLPLAWLILMRAFPDDEKVALAHPPANREPLRRNEIIFLIIFGAALFLWIFGPSLNQLSGGRLSLSLEYVGLAAAFSLFLPGIDLLTWEDAEKAIHKGTLLTVAGGLAAGVLLYQSGAARWLAALLLQIIPAASPAQVLILVLPVVFLLRLLFTTSTAAVALLTPLVITVAQNLGMDAWLPAMASSFVINLAFLLPVQAAVHLIAYSAGHYSNRDMTRGGVWLSGLAVVLIGILAFIVGLAQNLF
jgi:sodium-dependent dicarboxylate transporter 2/3/5